MKRIIAFAMLASLAIPQQSQGMHKKKKKKNITQTGNPSLDGKWVLSYIEGGELSELYLEKTPELHFDLKNGSISGHDGCNSISGPIKVENSKIIFLKPLLSTLRDCSGQGDDLFLSGLAKMTSFSFHGNDEIDLIGGDLGIMRLQRKK